jgi:hypothetical protein
MILGMSIATFTLLHVIVSLLGILFGFVAIAEMISNKSSGVITELFLGFTIATSASGFLFPIKSVDPAFVVGIISLVILALAVYARYARHLAGGSRLLYVVCAVVAQWFNVFVAIVQAFQKIGPLHALAPKGSEPPFTVVQSVVLLAFVVLGYLAAKRFNRMPAAAYAQAKAAR